MFDLSSKKTRIPTVILVLALGFGVRRLTDYYDIDIPNLFALLPFFGTVGLILIVLEGSLELEFNKAKLPVIIKTFWVSLIAIVFIAVLCALVLHTLEGYDFIIALINVLPLCIISSAIAIPTASLLTKKKKEFIVYESSLSDIIGVLLFNFFAANTLMTVGAVGKFFLDIGLMIVLSLLATILLAFLLQRLNHHVKFIPIIILAILVYEIAKILHLPSLLFILIFGLFLGNLDEVKHIKFLKKLKPEILNKEVHMFRDVAMEATFIIRTLFFLLFGFLMEPKEIFNEETFVWAIGICFLIYLSRFFLLKFSGQQLKPLIYIAPRGLITILLFIAIPSENQVSIINKSLIVQVIIITALIMMIGMMTNKEKKQKEPLPE